jgi:type 2 lantibiotic biosynthesis protein LanM
MDRYWQHLSEQEEQDACFLFFLYPEVQDLLETFQVEIVQSKHLSNILAEHFLFEKITEDFLVTLKWMVSRVCAVEMVDASQNGMVPGETPEERFINFNKLLADEENREAILNKYPILQELLNSFIDQYKTVTTEFLQRLDQDFAELRDTLLGNDKQWKLMNTSLSGDTHCEGRSVMVLTFECEDAEKKIVYKPKDQRVDNGFQELLKWLNINYADHFRTFIVLVKDGYGWCEYVQFKPCDNQQQVTSYYYHLGEYLALLSLLCGSDMHAENIIANGEYPVIVDGECLFRPFWVDPYAKSSEPPRIKVTDLIILPSYMPFLTANKKLDMSALGNQEGQIGGFKSMVWENCGTDNMRLLRVEKTMLGNDNLPKINGETPDSLEYETDFTQGFENCYQFFEKNKELVLAEDGPLQLFANGSVRVIFRATVQYMKPLIESYHPKLLYNRQERTAHFEPYYKITEKFMPFKSVVNAELEDLASINIPFFYSPIDDTKIYDSKHQLIDYTHLASGWDRVIDHIKNDLSENDFQMQKCFIRNSFQAARFNEDIGAVLMGPTVKVAHQHRNKQELIERSQHIITDNLDKLLAMVYAEQDRVVWPTITLLDDEVFSAGGCDEGLYDGSSGISLAFLYAGLTLDNNHYLSITDKYYQSLHTRLDNDALDIYSLGGYVDFGGLLNFVKCHDELNNTNSQQIRQHIINQIDELLEKDEALDIIGGSAGALLVCDDPVLQKKFIDKIISVYQHPQEVEYFGYAHGVAGMMDVMTRYLLNHPHPKAEKWVSQARVLLDGAYHRYDRIWPDQENETEELRLNTSWCHGAVGHGIVELNRIRLGLKHDEGKLQRAVELTLDRGFNSNLCLCHGIAGSLDFLLSTYELRPDIVSEEQLLCAWQTLLNALDDNGMWLQGSNQFESVGIMTGVAGVVYQLLRLTDPDQIPSILQFN